jgi:hypothetical protein
MFHGCIQIGEGFGLQRPVKHRQEKHSFAGSEGAGNLVRKVYMSRCVNKVQLELLARPACVGRFTD